MAGLFGVGARKCESMKAWTGVVGVCFFCRIGVLVVGAWGDVSAIGSWLELVIAGNWEGDRDGNRDR